MHNTIEAVMLEGWNNERVLHENRSYFPEKRKCIVFALQQSGNDVTWKCSILTTCQNAATFESFDNLWVIYNQKSDYQQLAVSTKHSHSPAERVTQTQVSSLSVMLIWMKTEIEAHAPDQDKYDSLSCVKVNSFTGSNLHNNVFSRLLSSWVIRVYF